MRRRSSLSLCGWCWFSLFCVCLWWLLWFLMLLEQQEDLEQRERIAPKHALVHHLDEALVALEALVDGRRRYGLVGVEDGLFEELQQHLVETAQLHHRAVVLLHELLDREARAAVAVAE